MVLGSMGCETATGDACVFDDPAGTSKEREMIEHVIEVPEIPFPGGSSQADFWREAASHLEGGYPVGGSNVTAAVVRFLRSVAEAVDGGS
jgi:hypothetical protein